jgi:hypothetical protein
MAAELGLRSIYFLEDGVDHVIRLTGFGLVLYRGGRLLIFFSWRFFRLLFQFLILRFMFHFIIILLLNFDDLSILFGSGSSITISKELHVLIFLLFFVATTTIVVAVSAVSPLTLHGLWLTRLIFQVDMLSFTKLRNGLTHRMKREVAVAGVRIVHWHPHVSLRIRHVLIRHHLIRKRRVLAHHLRMITGVIASIAFI